MRKHISIKGFALVELLLIAVIASIVIALAIVVALGSTTRATPRGCRDEAQLFQSAVKKFHDTQKKWPEDALKPRDNPSLDDIASELHSKNFPVTTHYLNGAEYRPPIRHKSGWLYDSTHHATYTNGCG